MVPWFGVYQCSHCCDARTSDVPTPTVTIAHPNLSGHLTFDEQYDPLSLLSPIFVEAKLILQKLWQLKCDWDDILPSDIEQSFKVFLSNLPFINDIEIPRKVIQVYPYKDIQLHGFADASTKAYGAVIYIRVTDFSDKHYTNILCSKVRIAPIKIITVPRLELCAALLLAELANKVKNALDINFNNCFLWSDSLIVLAWIQSPPNKFETFIANRISQIQRLSDKDQWRHVTSNQNPADIASRSMDPIQLKSSDLWFHGPPFLSKNSSEWTNPHVNNDISLPKIATISLTSSCFKPSEFELFKKLI
jgi:hypothetical protein